MCPEEWEGRVEEGRVTGKCSSNSPGLISRHTTPASGLGYSGQTADVGIFPRPNYKRNSQPLCPATLQLLWNNVDLTNWEAMGIRHINKPRERYTRGR